MFIFVKWVDLVSLRRTSLWTEVPIISLFFSYQTNYIGFSSSSHSLMQYMYIIYIYIYMYRKVRIKLCILISPLYITIHTYSFLLLLILIAVRIICKPDKFAASAPWIHLTFALSTQLSTHQLLITDWRFRPLISFCLSPLKWFWWQSVIWCRSESASYPNRMEIMQAARCVKIFIGGEVLSISK